MRYLLIVLALFTLATNIGSEENTDADALILAAQHDFQEQHFSDAASKSKEALALFDRKQDRAGSALAAYTLGMACSKIGRYFEAEGALRQSLKLHQELGDRPNEGFDLTMLAYIAMKQGDYDKSLDLTHQALAIHESLGAKKGIANCYRIIGNVYQYQGDHDKATEFSQRSLDLATEIGDKAGQAESLRNLGGVQWRLSNFDQALDYYAKALSIANEIGDKKTQSMIIGNTGLIYWNRGQPDEALKYFERCNALALEIGDLQTVATNLLNMGALHNDLEEYGKAQETLEKSLAMAQQIGDKGLQSAALDTLGTVHMYLGEMDLALDLTRQAAAIAEEIHEKRTLAYDLKSMAAIYGTLQKYNDALTALKKALHLYEELEEKRGIAAILNDTAFIYLLQKKYDDALPLYERASALAIEMKSDSMRQDSLRGLGWIYFAKKDMEQAEQYFSQSIELCRKSERPEGVWQSLYGKGLTLRDTHRNDEAIVLMKEAVDIIEKARNQVQLSEQKAAYFEEKLDVYEDLVRLLIASNNTADAFEYAQRSKARAFLDNLAEARIDPERNMDAALRKTKKDILKNLLQIQQDIQGQEEADSVDTAEISRLVEKRTDLEKKLDDLALEIRKKEPRLTALQYPPPIGLAAAKDLLDQKSVLLEYLIGKRACFLFVITSNDLKVHVLPPQSKLAAQISDLREALSKPEPVWESSGGWHTKYTKLAYEVYSELVAPVASELKRKERILIAPDGILNYLPFECLLMEPVKTKGDPDFSQLAYFGAQFEIQYAPSISVLAALKNNQPDSSPTRRKELLAFADPKVNSKAASTSQVRGGTGLVDLPNAVHEVENIARLFPSDQVKILEGAQASEQNVKKTNLAEYKRLHFASHGAINEERPQLSALVLSSEGHSEDGYLTTQEIFDLHLDADLVVLSACRTGLGRQIRGEGVMGLSRAFLRAGASSVLASLWDVYDESTADFMTDFYKNIKSVPKSAALKEARLQLIHSHTFSHPYYWAPFVLIGNQ